MICENIQEKFVEYLLGELSPMEERAVQQHLNSGCEQCHAEFAAIRDGIEFLYRATPRAELSTEKQKQILSQAMRVVPIARSELVDSCDAQVTVVDQSNLRDRDGRSQGSSAWQFLLALVAGFVLVFIYPVSQHTESPRLSQSTGMAGTLPAPLSNPKFVSFQEASQATHELGREMAGTLLVDTEASELHILGKSLVPALPGIPSALELDLEIVTPSGSVHHPLSVSGKGIYKAIVPLPHEPILKIQLGIAEKPESEAFRSIRGGRVS